MMTTLEVRSDPRHRRWTKVALVVSGAVFVGLFFGLLSVGLTFQGEITGASLLSIVAPVIGLVNLLGGLWLFVPQQVRLDDSQIDSRQPPLHRTIPWSAVRRLEIVGLDDDSAGIYGVTFVSSAGDINVGTDFSRSDLRRLSDRARSIAAERGIRIVEGASVAQLLEAESRPASGPGRTGRR